jgi:Na+-driven multidrug efflux pump
LVFHSLAGLPASLCLINHKLLAALLFTGVIPTIYTTVRIYFLGQMPSSFGFDIASQLSWINLIYEVIQEALILPLFFFMGGALSNKDELNNRIQTGIIAVFFIYLFLSITLIVFAVPLIRLMAQNSGLITETAVYIRLETIANIFAVLLKFLIVVIITVKKVNYLYLILIVQMILSVLLDTFFVSNLSISLKFGVSGIAYTNIIVNSLLFIAAAFILYREKIIFKNSKMSFAWIKNWSKIGGISGLESFVRNFIFAVMIIRMVNIVGEQGTFWVANNFIWGWLLLPILQLGELVKRDCGENGLNAVREKIIGYFAAVTIIVLLWFLTIPLWQPFLHHVMGLSNYKEVFYLALISIGFYVLFAYNSIIDSVFYGTGKTHYMLFQSLAVNILFYGAVFIFYLKGIYQPTLIKITLMFAVGIALDSILTYAMFAWMLKKKKLWV